MTRLMRPVALVLLLVSLTLPVAADQAKSWYEKGQDAEARQNYEQAYDDFKQAYDLKPKDLRYRSAFERLKFLAGASHVHRGKLLREAASSKRPWPSSRRRRRSIPRALSPNRKSGRPRR